MRLCTATCLNAFPNAKKFPDGANSERIAGFGQAVQTRSCHCALRSPPGVTTTPTTLKPPSSVRGTGCAWCVRNATQLSLHAASWTWAGMYGKSRTGCALVLAMWP